MVNNHKVRIWKLTLGIFLTMKHQLKTSRQKRLLIEIRATNKLVNLQ